MSEHMPEPSQEMPLIPDDNSESVVSPQEISTAIDLLLATSLLPEVSKERLKVRKEELVKAAVTELMFGEHPESFPFPGIDSEHYARMKSDEEEFPGCTTPIDEIIERFKKEGMKIVFGNNPGSGNVYVMPYESEDIERDAIQLKQLETDAVSYELLKKLIMLDKV